MKADTDVSMDGLTEDARVFVDTLLPGDADFPKASAVDIHVMLVRRWAERHGLGGLVEAFGRMAEPGGPLREAASEKRSAVVEAFAADSPDRFAALRRIVYLSYYETPAVVAVIAGLGHDYRAAPQPEGYALAAFDAGADAPGHGRGGYVATAAVSRVDMAGLDHLEAGR